MDTYGYLLPGSRTAADKFDEAVISELFREPGGEEATGAGLVSNVSKMLAKNSEKGSKKRILSVSRGGLEPPTG
jgi:hypothetical protein